jgi:hypothetical protein
MWLPGRLRDAPRPSCDSFNGAPGFSAHGSRRDSLRRGAEHSPGREGGRGWAGRSGRQRGPGGVGQRSSRSWRRSDVSERHDRIQNRSQRGQHGRDCWCDFAGLEPVAAVGQLPGDLKRDPNGTWTIECAPSTEPGIFSGNTQLPARTIAFTVGSRTLRAKAPKGC